MSAILSAPGPSLSLSPRAAQASDTKASWTISLRARLMIEGVNGITLTTLVQRRSAMWLVT